MNEAGIFKQIHETYEFKVPPPSPTENYLEPININQTSHIFSMIAVGVSLAELIIKIEILHKCKNFKIESFHARSRHTRLVKS